MTLEEKVLASPSTSYWLKSAVAALKVRDPVNAVRDAEILLEVAQGRLNGMATLPPFVQSRLLQLRKWETP